MSVGTTHRLGGYSAREAPGDLRAVVECVWTFERSLDNQRDRPHRVLPHNGLSLCFLSRRDSDGRVRRGDLCVMGPARRSRWFRPTPGLHIEAVRLKPEWSRTLLRLDPAEFADEVVGLASDGAVDRLRNALMRSPDPGEARALLLVELRRRLETGNLPVRCREVSHALDRIRTLDGSVLDLATIGRDAGFSERHLRRVIHAETGTPPKMFHRVERLNRAILAADRSADPPWARLALEHGYCDQSHFIREVGLLTGHSPTALHEQRRAQEGGAHRAPAPRDAGSPRRRTLR